MNFRGNWRNKMAAVSIAGPLSNLLQAIFWALFLKVLLFVGIHEPFFFEMVKAGIVINLMLMAFNLIPLPALRWWDVGFEYFASVSCERIRASAPLRAVDFAHFDFHRAL